MDFLHYVRRRKLHRYRKAIVKRWNQGKERKKHGTRIAFQRNMRKILTISALLEAYWMIHNAGGFFTLLEHMVYVEYVEESVPGGGERYPADGREHSTVKEGINIWVDDKAVSIFRLEEHQERGSD